jgi:ABC-2 type transport system permease protein
MRGIIFADTLKQARMLVLYWSIGMGLLSLVIGALVPLFNSQMIVELFESLPPIILAMAGIDEEMRILATTEGILAVAFFTRFSLIFSFYPIIMGLRVTTNEEEEGIMDVLLSLPVRRWEIVLERFMAYIVTMIVILVVIFIGLLLGVTLAGLHVDLGQIAVALASSLPLLSVLLAFTMCVGTILRGRRMVLAVATLFAVSSYILETTANMLRQTGGMAGLIESVSVYNYFDVTQIIQTGVRWGHVFGLSALAALLLLASLWLFQRREVGL